MTHGAYGRFCRTVAMRCNAVPILLSSANTAHAQRQNAITRMTGTETYRNIATNVNRNRMGDMISLIEGVCGHTSDHKRV